MEAILFDLDGTLVSDGPNWRQSVSLALRIVCDDIGTIDAEALESVYYDNLGATWEAIRDVPAPPFGNVDARDTLEGVWSATLSRFDAVSDARVRLAADTYLENRRKGGTAYDDTVGCLQSLRDAGHPLGVITNGLADTQHPKIRNAGLWDFFDVITTTDTGFGKPDPAMFHHALAALSVPADGSVYVGDSLRWDVGGANNTGMTSVWINRKQEQTSANDPAPDVEFTSLEPLTQWVAQRG